MVAASELDIAGADMLEDPEGRLWALEVNVLFSIHPARSGYLAGIVEAIELAANPGQRGTADGGGGRVFDGR
jgi:hypothetical protein